jgi:cyclic pyranopterin phosphate synthase
MPDLSHVDSEGAARMVDVSGKAETARLAVATGYLRTAPATIALVRARALPKGDVLTVAQTAGIQAAKQTAALIPMCHALPLTHVEVRMEVQEAGIRVTAEVRTVSRTGAEMEALTAVSVAALTLYDMLKAVDLSMEIGGLCLLAKDGGKRKFQRGTPPPPVGPSP